MSDVLDEVDLDATTIRRLNQQIADLEEKEGATQARIEFLEERITALSDRIANLEEGGGAFGT